MKCVDCEFRGDWDALRGHYEIEHPAYIRAVDAWISEGTDYKVPHDSEESCLG